MKAHNDKVRQRVGGRHDFRIFVPGQNIMVVDHVGKPKWLYGQMITITTKLICGCTEIAEMFRRTKDATMARRHDRYLLHLTVKRIIEESDSRFLDKEWRTTSIGDRGGSMLCIYLLVQCSVRPRSHRSNETITIKDNG